MLFRSNPAIPVVREGQEVQRGECIAQADGFLSVAMHAPVTGVVRRIGLVPVASGKLVKGIYIETMPASTQEVARGRGCALESSPESIVNAIQQAGIVGLGGAAFPTHAKLKAPDGNLIDTLIINGVECEPYLTTDHRVMLEQGESIVLGIRYLMKASGARRAIIGVEANKQDAAEHLSTLIPDDLAIDLAVVPVKYPQGAEKMLVKTALGREIPSGGLPLDVGAVVINVATAAEVGMLLPHEIGRAHV